MVSRYGIFGAKSSTSSLNSLLRRHFTMLICCSPLPLRIVWRSSFEYSTTTVGSWAAIFLRASPSFCSSCCTLALIAQRYLGAGKTILSCLMPEPGRERVVQRNIVHEVKHICPMNTRIINNHIFRHTYQPRYTCCEENVVHEQQCGSCCQFR